MSCPSTALCICVLAMSRVGCLSFMFSPSFVYLIIYNRITYMWLLVSGTVDLENFVVKNVT